MKWQVDEMSQYQGTTTFIITTPGTIPLNIMDLIAMLNKKKHSAEQLLVYVIMLSVPVDKMAS
jgi:hypothetical protein